MKIAIVITDFFESSIALTQALAEAKHDVDLYICTTHKNQINASGLEIHTETRSYGNIYALNYKKSYGANWCINNIHSNIYVVQCYHTGQHSTGIKKIVVNKLFCFYIKKFCNHIKTQHYDCIDIITQNQAFDILSKFLQEEHIVRSYHEVLDNHLNSANILPNIMSAIYRGEHIRVFSDKSANDILNLYNSINRNKLHIIPFGLFNSFKEFGHCSIPEIDGLDKYVLYFGQIHPYKGILYMYEAIKLLHERGIKVKAVFAGKGNDHCIEEMQKDENFIVINHFISNDELVYLIKRCHMVVCPYLSVSQSGIPQTAFVFGKPLIATNLGTFTQMIIPEETGLLVKPKDVEGLANAIYKLYTNDILYRRCCENLKDYERNFSSFSWKNIVKQYEIMIKKVNMYK